MTPPALLKTGFRDLTRRPLQTGLMVLGVALGVAVVVAIDLANRSALRAFARSSEAVAGRATHRLVGGPAGLPEAVLLRARTEWGVRACTPIVEGAVIAERLDSQPLRVLGVDPFSDGAFHAPLATGSWRDPRFLRLLTEPGAAIVGQGLARRYGLAPGDRLDVRVADRHEQLLVLGVLEGDAEAGLEGIAVMDVGMAQRLLGTAGRLTRIDTILSDAEARAVTARLPESVRLEPSRGQADTVVQLSDAFRLNLTALSGLALVVGMFLIYNTVTFAVVQRRPVFATLRALGATGEQVMALVLVEAGAAAALGSLLGLGLGTLLGQGAVRLVTRTVNDLYFLVAVTDTTPHWPGLARGLVLGVAAGVLAAVAPALEAARVEPAEALRPAAREPSGHRRLPRLAAAGAVLFLAGGLTVHGVPHPLWASFVGLFGVVVGIALLAPLATVGLARGVAPALARWVGPRGRLAAATVDRTIARTGVAVAALMVAVSVTIGVGAMIEGFRDTVSNWLDLSLTADVYVAAPSVDPRLAPTLSPEVVGRVAGVAGVEHVETFRAVRVASTGGDVRLGVTDAARGRRAELYRFAAAASGDPWEQVQAGAVVVSEAFARRHDVPPRGGSVELWTDHGPVRFPVAGVFYDYSTEEGIVLMSRVVYARHWDDPGVTSVAAFVGPGADAGEVAARVRTALSGYALRVTTNRALRERALAVFDRTFAVTQSLRVLAVLVAFVGVWSALMAVQLERTRELATLAALGFTGRDLAVVTCLESALMGLAAGLMSLPTGTLLARLLADVINVRSFGWSMRLHVAPGLLLQALALSVTASLIATAYPLLRLSRLPVAQGLRRE